MMVILTVPGGWDRTVIVQVMMVILTVPGGWDRRVIVLGLSCIHT